MGAKFHKTKELCKKTQLVGFLTLGLFFFNYYFSECIDMFTAVWICFSSLVLYWSSDNV